MADRYDDTLILGYLEGDLSDADRARLEAQMASDTALATLVERLRNDRAAMRRLPTEEPPIGLADAAMSLEERSMLLGNPDAAAPRATDPTEDHIRRFRLHRTVSYLAIAALVVICGGVMLISLSDPWFESGSRWLSDRGLTLGSEKPESALALKYNASQRPADAQQNSPSSEELLSDMLRERDIDQTRQSGRVIPTPAAPEAAIAGAVIADEASLAMAKSVAEQQDRGTTEDRLPGTSSIAADVDTLNLKGEQMGMDGPTMITAARTNMARPYKAKPPLETVIVNVNTDDVERTKAEVMHWVESNVAVIEAPPPTGPAENTLFVENTGVEDDPAEPALVVLVDERQVPQLISRLNELPGQRANMQAPSSGHRRAAAQLQSTVSTALSEIKRLASEDEDKDNFAGEPAGGGSVFELETQAQDSRTKHTSRMEVAEAVSPAMDEYEGFGARADQSESPSERANRFLYRATGWEQNATFESPTSPLLDLAPFSTRVELRLQPKQSEPAKTDPP